MWRASNYETGSAGFTASCGRNLADKNISKHLGKSTSWLKDNGQTMTANWGVLRVGKDAGIVVTGAISSHIHADAVDGDRPLENMFNISLSVRAAEGAFLVSPGSHLDGNRSAGWRRTWGATARWLKKGAEANAGVQRRVIAPGDAVLFCPSVLHGIDGPRKRSGSRRIARAELLITGRFR